MPDLGAYDRPVRFNCEAAAGLSREFRVAAAGLRGQVGQRRNNSALARRQWEGGYGQQFDGRLNVCTADAGRLAEAMVAAANAAKGADDLTEAIHYTHAKWAKSIAENGLRPEAYATPAGNLSPLQATLELALPPNRALIKVRVDIAGLRAAGFKTPTSPTCPARSRVPEAESTKCPAAATRCGFRTRFRLSSSRSCREYRRHAVVVDPRSRDRHPGRECRQGLHGGA